MDLPRLDSEALLVLSVRNGGGSDAYLDRFVKEEQKRHPVVILYPLPGGYEIEMHLLGGEICRAKVMGIDEAPLERKIPRCCGLFVNTLVHWPHIEACAFVGRLKSHYGSRLTVVFHDFNFVCPTWNLLYRGKVFCGCRADCSSCLPHVDLAAFRAASAALMAQADELRFFSSSSRALVNMLVPVDDEKATVVPHQPLDAFKPLLSRPASPLVIAVVGNLTAARGSDFVADFAKFLLAQEPSARLVILGRTERPYSMRNVIVHGAYEHDELPVLMDRYGVNVGFLTSICPETFSYVVQELMMLGLPVACFDFGAQAERVGAYTRGAVIPTITPQAAYEKIRGLI